MSHGSSSPEPLYTAPWRTKKEIAGAFAASTGDAPFTPLHPVFCLCIYAYRNGFFIHMQ